MYVREFILFCIYTSSDGRHALARLYVKLNVVSPVFSENSGIKLVNGDNGDSEMKFVMSILSPAVFIIALCRVKMSHLQQKSVQMVLLLKL